MSKWVKEWSEVAAICAAVSFFLVIKGRWFLLACVVLLVWWLS